jgi:hypothetical protein
MEIRRSSQSAAPLAPILEIGRGGCPRTPGGRPHDRERAEQDIAAAIATVAGHPGLRVQVCGMASDPALIRRMDERAAAVHVLLVWHVRRGGALDVVARAA